MDNRRTAEQTRRLILHTARELFARQGIGNVSVRTIAQAAGVNHALVHRYCGTKDDMVAQILREEVAMLEGITRPDFESDPQKQREDLRELLRYVMTELETSMLFVVRAQMEGYDPGKLLPTPPATAVSNLAVWLAGRQQGTDLPDPQLTAVIMAGAMYALMTISPWLLACAGLPEDTYRKRLDEIIDIIIGILEGTFTAPGQGG